MQVRNGASQKQVEVADGKYPILATGGEIGRTNTPIYCRESVLIGRKGTIDKPVYMNTPFWTVDTLFYTELADEVNGRFVYAMFQTIPWKRFDTSTGVPSLTSSTIHAIKKFTPVKLTEQIRIGEFFRVLDDLIAAAKKKADLLKLKKRYYLQAIFSQQLRFKGFTEPWQQRKLGELLSVRKETTTTPTLYRIDIELENLQEDGGLVGDTTVRTNSTSVFRRGDVLFGRLRPYLRKWWLATEPGIRSGEIWAIYSPSRVLTSSFVYALVQSPIFLQVALITSGTKMPRSDWENIASAAGSLPCSNDEQARIGDFFNMLDNLIAASWRKIELLERCKAAYLQLLFI